MRREIVSAVAGALLLSACTTTARFEPYRSSEAELHNGDGIVILARRNHSTHEAEQEFIDCISDSLASSTLDIRVLSSAEFEDGLYPFFEPSTAPGDLGEMKGLLDRPGFAGRVADLGVRFIAWVDGSTDRVSSGGNIACVAGIGGGGCMGLAYWEDFSRYDVAVWDIESGDETGTVYADVRGRSFMPAVVVPIPFIARPRAKACRGLTEHIEALLGPPNGDRQAQTPGSILN